MRDVLRAEFPGAAARLSRLRLPEIRREPAVWAALSALGIALVVGAVLRLALFLAPSWPDQTVRLPLGATFGSLATFIAHLAAGVVLRRAGGWRGLGLYLAYVAVEAATGLPGVLLFCDRSRPEGMCAAPLVFIAAGRAPQLVGIATGVLLGRWYPTGPVGSNRTLRGAGVFSVALFLASTPVGYLSYAGALSGPASFGILIALASVLAGLAAGIVLARAPLAGALLVALATTVPSLVFAVTLSRDASPADSLEFTVARWSSQLAPVLAGVALLIARLLARRRDATEVPGDLS
ncbi:MAG TPA: hypothetical protein VFM06_11325 [Candidatus Limnocylindria bacterium]|nr:hypothetical protein [Candidatus Limnocylindria bacterium]